MSTKSGQIEWRREQVIQMKARGMSQTEIARELQVSKQLISDDVQYLRQQAKQIIKEYATDHLPEQYQICLTALDEVIKYAFYISVKSNDNREKLHALELYKDTHQLKVELMSNATTIENALQFIRNKQQAQQRKKPTIDDDNDDSSTRITSATATTEGKQTVF